MEITAEPIDWVIRPDPLISVEKAFAVHVVGDSMEPRIEHGERVYVNPALPPRRGDDVLLVNDNEPGTWKALVKRLDRWDTDNWHVRQYSPAKEFTLKKRDWPKAFVIVSRASR